MAAVALAGEGSTTEQRPAREGKSEPVQPQFVQQRDGPTGRIFDPEGRVRHVFKNVRVNGHVEAVMKALDEASA